MAKTSDTYQIASDIQWQDAGEGIVRQIMGYDEHLMRQASLSTPSALCMRTF